MRILIDGTLIIFRVKPEDAGKYTCVPSNSLGRSPSASAYLTVQCEWARWPCWGREGCLGEGGQRRGRGEGGGQPWRRPARGWLVSAGEWSPLWVLLLAMQLSLSTDPSRRPHPGWAQGQAGLLDTVLVLVPASSSVCTWSEVLFLTI